MCLFPRVGRSVVRGHVPDGEDSTSGGVRGGDLCAILGAHIILARPGVRRGAATTTTRGVRATRAVVPEQEANEAKPSQTRACKNSPCPPKLSRPGREQGPRANR